MKDIRLIALDLDGTLLDSKKCLSRQNREALLECMRRGIEVVPCTGRIWSGVPDFIRELPGLHYAITVNGAVVEDLRHGFVLDEQKMSREKAVEILELARGFHTMYDVYVGGSGFGEQRFMTRMEDYGITLELQKMIQNTRTIVPDVIELVKESTQLVEKINCFFGDQEERQKVRKALTKRGDVLVTASFSNNLEINEPGAAKGEAVMRLARHLDLKPQQTMGFGDGENDWTLISQTGIGVAMANAIDSLKEVADYVTLTNDEDGVAAALKHLLGIAI
ncbi:MAG: HAD family phosphatase [Lachnospiraceae bacterium]|jgi:Cof subfamily protein (haloacid dehalogenase superfamily)|nr:HAD family phosphatase [Lachnospiraceae bacterium]